MAKIIHKSWNKEKLLLKLVVQATMSPLYHASEQLSIPHNKLPYQQRSWQPNRKSASKSGWQRGPGGPGGGHHPGRGDDDRHGGRGDGQLRLLVLGGRSGRRRGKSAHTGIKFWYSEKATKILKYLPICLTLLSNFKKRGIFLPILWHSHNIWTFHFASNYPSRSFLIFSF